MSYLTNFLDPYSVSTGLEKARWEKNYIESDGRSEVALAFQMPSKSVNDAQPFFYLAFVAYLYPLNGASEKLMNASSKGMHGTIALSHQGKQDVSRKINAEQSTEIAAAIRELTARRFRQEATFHTVPNYLRMRSG
jgi:hypothetical protein